MHDAEIKIRIFTDVEWDDEQTARVEEEKIDTFRDRLKMAIESFKYPGWKVEVLS